MPRPPRLHSTHERATHHTDSTWLRPSCKLVTAFSPPLCVQVLGMLLQYKTIAAAFGITGCSWRGSVAFLQTLLRRPASHVALGADDDRGEPSGGAANEAALDKTDECVAPSVRAMPIHAARAHSVHSVRHCGGAASHTIAHAAT